MRELNNGDGGGSPPHTATGERKTRAEIDPSGGERNQEKQRHGEQSRLHSEDAKNKLIPMANQQTETEQTARPENKSR
jgi:hypothetical protein